MREAEPNTGGDTGETLVVGRIGKPHGLRGEVTVEPRTDEPERRFALGAHLIAQRNRPEAGAPATLTVAGSRWHSGRLLLRFEEIADRDAAEAARGTMLLIPLDRAEEPEADGEYYDHQLIGLRARADDGREVGSIAEIIHGAAQDLLVIRPPGGGEILVPFVEALVPVVDLAAGVLVIADRPGLLSPGE